MSNGLKDALQGPWVDPGDTQPMVTPPITTTGTLPSNPQTSLVFGNDEDTEYLDLGDFLGDGFAISSAPTTSSDAYGYRRWSTKHCECGAKYTSNPNLHERYCPLYKDPMGG